MIEVGLSEALGKYLAEDIVAGIDVPPFDRAVVDGYAVRSRDTFGASPRNPAILRLKGIVSIGSRVGEHEVLEGEALEIQTGAPLPRGADAVVMYENTRRIDNQYVEIYAPVPPMGNVSRRGEDVKAGEKILSRGHRLQPWDLGVIASLGISRVKIYRPMVSIICTGNELVEVEDFDRRGYEERGVIVNSTRHAIEGLVRSMGFEAIYMGIARDNVEEIYSSILKALEKSDVVITTGGISVGSSDNTIKAVMRLDPEYMVHGIAIRPGRPTSIAVVRGKPIIMLSGFPVAAITGFEALARPILLNMVGAEDEPRATVRGILTRRVSTPINTRSFVRVRIYRGGDGKTYIEPLALTGSGILSTLVRGNGILIVPENREGYDEGEEVEAILLRGIEE
ncbi:MAG TPA: gephyrin-like molybdotransferase Glp [Sulfolobales archaeon]|nr:gephyrin-like molybdotransferase Glp [Sulfolobales archaeon]